jgi:ribonuclease HII
MLQLKHTNYLLEAGTDEAGRGCLSGPVTAAAVILPPDFKLPKLNDSKQLSEKIRFEIRPHIESEAVAWSVFHVSPKKVDELNVLQASIHGMHESLKKLKVTPEFILVDGNRFKPFMNIPFECMIKGDGRFMNIAAASILAKTYRDELMEELHEKFPVYGWNQNKGYPTLFHRNAIRLHGTTEHHRMSFKLLPEQLKLPL